MVRKPLPPKRTESEESPVPVAAGLGARHLRGSGLDRTWGGADS